MFCSAGGIPYGSGINPRTEMAQCRASCPRWPSRVSRWSELNSAAAVQPCFSKRNAFMSDRQQRLIRCFLGVFPEVSEGEVSSTSVSNLAAWDSVATVTLAAAMEEEFGIQLEPEEIEKMNSFPSCLNLLNNR